MTASEITDESAGLPIPHLHDSIVAATDDPFFVHANAPHKFSVSIGVTLKAKHPNSTGYSAVSTSTQNDTMTTGVTHARD